MAIVWQFILIKTLRNYLKTVTTHAAKLSTAADNKECTLAPAGHTVAKWLAHWQNDVSLLSGCHTIHRSIVISPPLWRREMEHSISQKDHQLVMDIAYRWTRLEVSKTTMNSQCTYSLTHLQNGNDHSKQADSTAKDFYDENSHKQSRVLCVGQGCSGPDNTDADATEQVWESDRQTGGKHGIACQVSTQTNNTTSKQITKSQKNKRIITITSEYQLLTSHSAPPCCPLASRTKKNKVVSYSITSVGHGADPHFLAVSL